MFGIYQALAPQFFDRDFPQYTQELTRIDSLMGVNLAGATEQLRSARKR